MVVKWTEVERHQLCFGKGLADVMGVGDKRNQGIKKTSQIFSFNNLNQR